jgi:hypothetical protein
MAKALTPCIPLAILNGHCKIAFFLQVTETSELNPEF